MSRRTILARLEDILNSIAAVKGAVRPHDFERLKTDRFFRFGIERAVEIISEASRHIPDELKQRHAQIPWPNIKAFGNIIRHEYESVDPEILWDIVHAHLDPLAVAIDKMKEDESLLMSESTIPSRIEARFAALKKDKRPALVTFISAGDPDLATSEKILAGLPKAGADIIELGMPFSDPMADGPAIQMSSQRALKSGQTMIKTLDMVRRFRAQDKNTPLVLMGYYNPIYVYGNARFLKDAKDAGVDGLIVVDVPPEADDELCLPAVAEGLNFIRLATPTTDAKRLPAVLKNTSGFVYYVSITGITGAAAPVVDDVHNQVKRIKGQTELPVVVGFGVRTGDQAKALAKGADGVVVGSALVQAIEKSLDSAGHPTAGTVSAVLNMVKELAAALRAP